MNNYMKIIINAIKEWVGAQIATRQPVGDYALKSDIPTLLPSVTASDSGKFLRVSTDGTWVAQVVLNAEEVTY